MSLSEFISMNGYGFYVWSSFGATALLMFAEPLIIKAQHRTIVKRLCRMLRINSQKGRQV